ncbi:helix-turn-helix domain-containing protein [Microbacterium sp. JC 701]|uniref:helix-turn-helix domain-containing protein n=1 Tax=Microbacterium sp. JC 701 TaxID=2897389 RepID=UPI001E57C515|nr:helix-turn-helix domain-containing protein [Microbacterium sp. JC 701]MCD2170370.1 helix-turn-helix domain-containing protein [Microbacterium sp. JC 701]
MSGGRSGPVLTTKGAAAYCGIAVQTLYNELSAGTGPTSHKQGRLNAFYEADLDAWLKTRITEREMAVAS